MNDEPRSLPELTDLEDEYDILGELGRGGSAIVYHGLDRTLGRDVAIKVVRSRFATADDDAIARLTREARTVAQLEHANIVKVHAVKRLRDEGLALVMQYVPGRTLKRAVEEDGPFPVERAEQVLRDIARALAYANGRGVVHRDVKPENIFLDATTGRALLADFGIAHSSEFESRLTMTGTAIGTPAYMAPEQIDGAEANARSDVYSLGLCTWEMLTGHRPWAGESLYNVIFKQKNEQLPPIDEFRNDVPPRFQYIVERMLQKKPAARWAGADGMLAHLEASVLPSDWSAWQEAHRKRQSQRRTQPRSKAVQMVATAMATIRFRRSDVADMPVTAPAAVIDDAASAADATNDEPTWVTDARATKSPRFPQRLMAAALLLVVAGGGATLYATRNAAHADSDIAPRVPEPLMRDVGSLGVPVIPDSVRDSIRVADSILAERMLAGDAFMDSAGVVFTDSARTAAPADAGRMPAAGPNVVYAVPLGGARNSPPPPSTVGADAGSSARGMASGTLRDASPAPAINSVRATDDLGVIAAGGRHTCVVRDSRTLCWGANDEGQLGDGKFETRADPDGTAGELAFVQVSSGIAHSCGVNANGDAYCWGANDRGQLGDATTLSRSAPVRVSGNYTFRAVRTGRAHSCGLTSVGDVLCWGNNSNGQLGDGSGSARTTPVRIASATRFISLTAGWNHSCAISIDGGAWCWGDNSAGQLGDGSTNERRTPESVRSDLRFTSIASGSAHTCAVSTSGDAWCWGRNSNGQLGNGTTSDRTSPARVELSARIASVSSGSVHNCARTNVGAVFCWGRNSYGQLGDGSTTDRVRPVRVTGGTAFAAVNATGAHTCGISTDGEALCWGFNNDGQLGDGSRTHRSRPVRVQFAAR